MFYDDPVCPSVFVFTATMEQLRAGADKMDEVQSLLAGAAAIPGDIPPDKLTAALDDRITRHFSRWDINSHTPEKGRGIDNPWANKIGPLLESWYAMETVRRKMNDVIRHEQAVDDINARIHRIDQEMAGDEEFVRTGRSLRDGLGKRAGLEERCQRLTGELRHLKEIMIAWPGAEQVIQAKESERTGVTKDLESTETELKNARKRAQAEQLREAHARLVTATEEWRQATTRLAESKAVPPEQLTELTRLEKEIDRLRINIAAQKLTAKMESNTPLTAIIQRGTEEPETISISPSEACDLQADGIFRLNYQDLKLSIESGTGDVNALFTDLETARQSHSDILKSLGHETLAAARLADAEHQKHLAAESTQKALHRAALQGRTEDEWQADMAALAQLPDTRSVDVLEGEKSRLLERKATLDLEIRQERGKIEKWSLDHVDLDSLTDKILTQTAAANQAKQELSGLPDLPEGFSTIPEYLDLLGEKENAREQHDQSLKDLKIEQARLTGAAPANTAEELRAELEVKQREFERQQATGEALLRIRTKLQVVISERDADDPMRGLTHAISKNFSQLTDGRYDEVILEGLTPTQVGGTLSLDTALLSQGTLGSLALATRLALSELYLKGMDGFLLLDDPFTDMDAARRAAAMRAIGDFSENHQVLFFTCHPEHADELQHLVGAGKPQLSE